MTSPVWVHSTPTYRGTGIFKRHWCGQTESGVLSGKPRTKNSGRGMKTMLGASAWASIRRRHKQRARSKNTLERRANDMKTTKTTDGATTLSDSNDSKLSVSFSPETNSTIVIAETRGNAATPLASDLPVARFMRAHCGSAIERPEGVQGSRDSIVLKFKSHE